MDAKGIIYVHLAGRPLSEHYTSVIERATCAMESAAEGIRFRDGQRKGRRGFFNVVNVGISSGNGNSVCPCKLPIGIRSGEFDATFRNLTC